MERPTVYTVLSPGADACPPLGDDALGWRCIAFVVEGDGDVPAPWEARRLARVFADPGWDAWRARVLPHLFLPDADASVFVAAGTALARGALQGLARLPAEGILAIPGRPGHEAAGWSAGWDQSGAVGLQALGFRSPSSPRPTELLWRRHWSADCRRFADAWWSALAASAEPSVDAFAAAAWQTGVVVRPWPASAQAAAHTATTGPPTEPPRLLEDGAAYRPEWERWSRAELDLLHRLNEVREAADGPGRHRPAFPPAPDRWPERSVLLRALDRAGSLIDAAFDSGAGTVLAFSRTHASVTVVDAGQPGIAESIRLLADAFPGRVASVSAAELTSERVAEHAVVRIDMSRTPVRILTMASHLAAGGIDAVVVAEGIDPDAPPALAGDADATVRLEPIPGARAGRSAAFRVERLPGNGLAPVIAVAGRDGPVRDPSRSQVLVSFANASPGSDWLGLLDLEPPAFAPIPIPDELRARGSGATGLAQDERFVYAAHNAELLVLDRETFRLCHEAPLAGTEVAHSIALRGRLLTVVSTNTDELLSYTLDEEGWPGSPTVTWRPDPHGPRIDRHHLNGIWPRPGGEGFVVCGMDRLATFDDVGRRLAADGFVCTVPEGDLLAEGQWYPHSVTITSEGIAWCESAVGVVHIPRKGVIRTGAGFVRGLCEVGDLLLVGTSANRYRLLPGVPLDQRCRVLAYRTTTLEPEWSLDLGAWGEHVYELMPLR